MACLRRNCLLLAAVIAFWLGLTFVLLNLTNNVPENLIISHNSLQVVKNYIGYHKKEVRVLCWVMTSPENHVKKAQYVKDTWGKRCNKLIFMSSQNDTELGAVGLQNVSEGRNWLWAKTKESFKYIWKNHRNEADWFLKADDDTYVVVENLKFFLSKYDPMEPIYFGCHFSPSKEKDYMSGGAGYVLSTEALRRFIETALPDTDNCEEGHDGSEDLEMGKCLKSVGVVTGDSRDKLGRHRFMPFNPEYHIFEPFNGTAWYWKYMHYQPSLGMDCCSNTAISFHYVTPHQMTTLEYLIYHLKPSDISYAEEDDLYITKSTTVNPNKNQTILSALV